MRCSQRMVPGGMALDGRVEGRLDGRRDGGWPADPRTADLRIDDEARREAAEVLGVHMAAGRLTLAEYEARLDPVFAAVTQSDLTAVIGDLPPTTTAASRRRQRAAARSMVAGWLALCALFLTIWALTGAGYFWPVWPMMGTAIGTLPGAWAVWRGTAGGQSGRSG